MKNTLVLLIGVCLFSLTACMKENTCTCTAVSNGSTLIMTTKGTSNEKNAKSWCEGLESTVYVQSGQTTSIPWSCALD